MKCSKKVCFHGMFKTKNAAVKKERAVDGFIRRVKVKGRTRYLVMTSKKG